MSRLEVIVTAIVAVLLVIVWFVAIFSPGIVVAYLGWRLSSDWLSVSAQTFFRAALIAIAVAPSIWGHAGFFPAIFVALLSSGTERLVGVVPILVVWIVAIPIIGILAKRRERHETGKTS
jgi:hypothetical protein